MKKFALIFLVAVMALAMSACGRFTCDFCKEEKFGKINKFSFLGENMQYCNSCKEDLEDLANSLKDLT